MRRVDLAGLSRGPWWIYICLLQAFGCWAVVCEVCFEHRDSNNIPWIPVGIAGIPDDAHRLCLSVTGTKTQGFILTHTSPCVTYTAGWAMSIIIIHLEQEELTNDRFVEDVAS